MKTLAEFMDFAEGVGEAVRKAVGALEHKVTASIKELSEGLSEVKSVANSAATIEMVEQLSAAITMQATDLRTELDARIELPDLVQVKSITGEGKTVSFELTDGRAESFEIPVLDGKDGVDGKDGRDGKDGNGIADVKSADGTMTLYLSDGREHAFALPMPLAPALPALPVDISDAMQDKSGDLVLVMSNGTTRNVGRVAGRDGIDGINGRDGEPGLRGFPGENGIDGRNGENGIDGLHGRDGFGFDDMSVDLMDDGRTVNLKFTRGDQEKVFPIKFAVPIFRGSYSGDTVYEAGDVVSFNGSSYSAKSETIGVIPEVIGGPWVQMTASGRSVRGERGIAGKNGTNGTNGKDLRAFT